MGAPDRAEGGRVRPRCSCGPCGAASSGSRDRRGCASGGGNRAPCDGGGCWAGTCACSRRLSFEWRIAGRVVRPTGSHRHDRPPGRSAVPTGAPVRHHRYATFGRHRPPTPDRLSASPGHGHAAPVDTQITSDDRPTVRARAQQGQTLASRARPPSTDPVENRLRPSGCRVRFLATEVPRRGSTSDSRPSPSTCPAPAHTPGLTCKDSVTAPDAPGARREPPPAAAPGSQPVD